MDVYGSVLTSLNVTLDVIMIIVALGICLHDSKILATISLVVPCLPGMVGLADFSHKSGIYNSIYLPCRDCRDSGNKDAQCLLVSVSVA